jgi:glycosyltransferase involved in cell wall biosynthesis
MKNPTSSIVIPTYNRPDSLWLTLDGLFNQTILPTEIILVDDSTNDLTEKKIDSWRKKSKGIPIIYVKKDPDKRGTTFSRNIGIDKAKGDYIFFLDDDITIHSDYIESTFGFFKANPKANAVQWFAYSDHDVKYDYGALKNFFMRLFHLGYYAKDLSIVLPSMASVIPHPLTGNISTQYMGAGTSVIKREALKGVRFDEKLTGYALQEDLDFSYQLHKKSGHLYLLKDRKLHHAYSLTARMDLKKIMYTKFVYLAYIFKKNIPQTLFNLSLFWVSMIGRILLRVANLYVHPSRTTLEEARFSIQAIFSVALHFRELSRNPNYFKTSA